MFVLKSSQKVTHKSHLCAVLVKTLSAAPLSMMWGAEHPYVNETAGCAKLLGYAKLVMRGESRLFSWSTGSYV